MVYSRARLTVGDGWVLLDGPAVDCPQFVCRGGCVCVGGVVVVVARVGDGGEFLKLRQGSIWIGARPSLAVSLSAELI